LVKSDSLLSDRSMRDKLDPTIFAIHIYEDVEPIDIGATFGVLSMARRVAPGVGMFLVAQNAGPVRAANGLVVSADFDYGNCPSADVLILTGGPGWAAEAGNPATLEFVKRRAPNTAIASVCTGGLILAATGLLAGRTATTKRAVTGAEQSPLEIMRARHPEVGVIEARLVDDGSIVTGGGVALAIDVTLHLIEKFYGFAVADEVARIIEYRTAWHANKASFEAIVGASDARR
jgi:transcriptional regulator GlxA family with amidase domain